jgi:hypothetical protein
MHIAPLPVAQIRCFDYLNNFHILLVKTIKLMPRIYFAFENYVKSLKFNYFDKKNYSLDLKNLITTNFNFLKKNGIK